MRRRLLNLAFVLCLLVSAAATTLWARSYYRADRWRYTTWSDRNVSVGHMFTLESVRGELALKYMFDELSLARAHDGGQAGFDRESWTVTEATHYLPFGQAGMGDQYWGGGWAGFWCYYTGTVDPPSVGMGRRNWREWQIAAPHWLPAFAFAVPLVVRCVSNYRRARRSPLLCAQCGYDLRATPDRCPECGTVPASAPCAGG